MKTTEVKVIQSAEKPVPVEVLAESIVAISQGVKRLLDGPLAEDTIVLLISDAAPSVGQRYNAHRVTKGDIRAVLRGLKDLERVHLKPKK